MNIRWKVGALIATLFVVLGVSEVFVADSVLLPSFTDLERSEADVAMRRVRYALDRSFEQVALSTTSWGTWEDTYQFAHDHNRAFVDVNVTVAGLKELNVSAAVIIDEGGLVIASGAVDLESNRPRDVNQLGRLASEPDFPWRRNLHDGRPVRGFLWTDDGIMLVAAGPVLDGLGRGPPRGMVMMGRTLSAAAISQLGTQSQVRLELLPTGGEVVGKHIVETDSNTEVYETLADIYGHPVVTLRVTVPREITRRGRSAVYYATACLMGAAVIVVILLILILNKVVLTPLARVTRHAVKVGQDADLTSRLAFDRADEIGVLARELDRMVARVAESRSQLVDQSFRAGLAELAKGILHNLGNAMTPLGVRLAVLQKRLRSTSNEDFELAADELCRTELDPARRADLGELVRLASGSLAATLRAAEEDVEVITRQISIVRSALSEQVRFTHDGPVWEAVRLADLLAQSLEVVPDVARCRLRIEADASVDQIGAVYVPRTLLRMVLQNLIINAADAVGETGVAQGSLRFAAQLTQASGREQLLLHCTDNGVGIATEHLARIFEKGFSTKSRETNFGIGLHWCANALGSIGGRVWATSDGVARGAALHVLLPLKSLEDRVAIRVA